MRVIDTFRSSLQTLTMNGRRTFLTMIGIIIGIASVITIMSLGNGFQKQTMEDLAKDEYGRRSQEFYYEPATMSQDYSEDFKPFSNENLQEIEEIQGVDQVELMGSAQEMTSTSMLVNLLAQDEYLTINLVDQSDYDLVIGRNLSIADTESAKFNVIISEFLARKLFGRSEEAYHQSLRMDQQLYTIVGVYEDGMESQMMETDAYLYTPMIEMPMGTYRRNTDMPEYNYGIRVFFQDEVDMKLINQRINQYLTDNGAYKDQGSYSYYDASEWMDELAQQLQMITLFIMAIAAISLFIAGVGVMNMMYISVSERTKEIGIRRALGATQENIARQFLLEGVAITTIGGFIGYILGIVLAQIISNFLPFPALVSIDSALISVLISVIIGIVFSVFPSRQAASKNLIDILR